jgi:hypothetical protein
LQPRLLPPGKCSQVMLERHTKVGHVTNIQFGTCINTLHRQNGRGCQRLDTATADSCVLQAGPHAGTHLRMNASTSATPPLSTAATAIKGGRAAACHQLPQGSGPARAASATCGQQHVAPTINNSAPPPMRLFCSPAHPPDTEAVVTRVPRALACDSKVKGFPGMPSCTPPPPLPLTSLRAPRVLRSCGVETGRPQVAEGACRSRSVSLLPFCTTRSMLVACWSQSSNSHPKSTHAPHHRPANTVHPLT